MPSKRSRQEQNCAARNSRRPPTTPLPACLPASVADHIRSHTAHPAAVQRISAAGHAQIFHHERDDRVQRGDDLRRVRQRNEKDPGQDGRRIGGGGGRACQDGDGVERWIHDEAGHAGRLAQVVRGQRQERRARQLE